MKLKNYSLDAWLIRGANTYLGVNSHVARACPFNHKRQHDRHSFCYEPMKHWEVKYNLKSDPQTLMLVADCEICHRKLLKTTQLTFFFFSTYFFSIFRWHKPDAYHIFCLRYLLAITQRREASFRDGIIHGFAPNPINFFSNVTHFPHFKMYNAKTYQIFLPIKVLQMKCFFRNVSTLFWVKLH